MIPLNPTGETVMQIQFWICVLLAAFFAALLVAGQFPEHRWARIVLTERSRSIRWTLLGVALAASVNYFYLSRTPTWIHRWDLFHTLITTRYFDELGYFGLYESSIAVDEATNRNYRNVKQVRDLRTLEHVPRSRILADARSASAFSPERRAAFAADLRFFNSINPKHRWRRLFRDKGYNGSPFYTFVVRLIARPLELTRGNLLRLGMLDLVLLAAAFLSVYWAYGLRACLLALIFFCVLFPNRFVHMGGSVLRFGYIAFLIMGLSCLRKDRHALAGAFFGLATMERIFPALFVVGFALKTASDRFRVGRWSRRHLRLLVSAAATMTVCFLLTLTVTGGLDIWREFVDNISLHTRNTAGFRIGFKHMFMLEGSLTGPGGFIPYPEKTELFRAARPDYWIGAALLLVPTLFLLRKLDEVSFTVLFGALAFFVLLAATRYYYSLLVLLFLPGLDLSRDRGFQASCLALSLMSAVVYRVFLDNQFAPFIYNTLFSAMLTVYFAALLLWLLFRPGTLAERAG